MKETRFRSAAVFAGLVLFGTGIETQVLTEFFLGLHVFALLVGLILQFFRRRAWSGMPEIRRLLPRRC